MWLEADDEQVEEYYYGMSTNSMHTTASAMALFKSKGPVSLYIVSPSLTTSFNPRTTTTMPLTLATSANNSKDYMVSGKITVDPNVPADLRQTVTFKHVLTFLEFRITKAYTGTVRFNEIGIEFFDASGAEAPVITTAGTIDVRTGELVPRRVSSVQSSRVLRYGGDLEPSQDCEFLLPEIPHIPGGKMRVTFRFGINKQGTSTADYGELVGQEGVIEIPFDNVLTEGTAQGFKQGYHYLFNRITIQNFIKYQGYPEVQEWTMPDENDPDDERVYEIIF
jgi:hypothetical protein